nr:hypothetical protein [Morchella crassipes]
MRGFLGYPPPLPPISDGGYAGSTLPPPSTIPSGERGGMKGGVGGVGAASEIKAFVWSECTLFLANSESIPLVASARYAREMHPPPNGKAAPTPPFPLPTTANSWQWGGKVGGIGAKLGGTLPYVCTLLMNNLFLKHYNKVINEIYNTFLV